MGQHAWMDGDFTGFDEKSIRHLKEIIRNNNRLYADTNAVKNCLLTELTPFVPNWKKNGFKSREDGVRHILSFLKKEEKHIANRGYGLAKIMDGNLNTRIELKGDPKLKRKKEFVQNSK